MTVCCCCSCSSERDSPAMLERDDGSVYRSSELRRRSGGVEKTVTVGERRERAMRDG